MINCIAIDDEPLALAQLTGYISRVPFLNLVASCQDAFEAMKVLSSEKIDLLFLDINMPDLNGMEFVRSLSEKPLVIFTTAYSEYAVDGFKVEAVDYLLKPFSFQDLLAAASKAARRLDRESAVSDEVIDDALFVKNDYRVTRVRLADIKYIEGMSEYVRIYVENEEKPLMPLLSMKRLEEMLPASQFMRVHRSYIVNLKKITEISRLRIVFGETYIPIGDIYKEKFLEYVNNRMMR
ncbi:MAG: LytTR family DNA-binding domain-containing protein [Bacteroides sp.]|nr:LytTR family DNA-binding domain-containing protein [Bacteroides sp.]